MAQACPGGSGAAACCGTNGRAGSAGPCGGGAPSPCVPPCPRVPGEIIATNTSLSDGFTRLGCSAVIAAGPECLGLLNAFDFLPWAEISWGNPFCLLFVLVLMSGQVENGVLCCTLNFEVPRVLHRYHSTHFPLGWPTRAGGNK